jgi:calcium/calmodulin-dependent 3',5'-cyclic nucleotide phosphodiesterase
MNEAKMIEKMELEENDVISFLVAALAHDFKHTGQTNAFHINKQTDLALLYNDRSILENYHISETFKVLADSRYNIFSKMSKNEMKLIRKRIIDLIIATDMSFHTKIYTSVKLKCEIQMSEKIEMTFNFDSPSAKFDTQQEILNYTLHAADLSHNVKSFEITQSWTNMLMNEFWEQGDIEKREGLPVSFNCDRLDTNVPKGQMGFLNGIIIPTFQLLAFMFPKVEYLVDNAKNNYEEWNKLLLNS